MKDKELYNHFKDRSHKLDEMPSDELWNNIAKKMDNENMPKKKRFTSLIVIAVLTISVIVFLLLPSNEKSTEQENAPASIVVTDTLKTSSEAIINNKTAVTKANEQSPEVKKTLQIDTTTLTIRRGNHKENTAILDSIKPNTNKIKLTTQKSRNQILIEIGEKITQLQFDSIIDASFNEYKTAYNTILLVRAPNLKPYRARIKKHSKLPNKDTLTRLIKFGQKRDSISTSKIKLINSNIHDAIP
ncbi:MAG: hypothetical protein BM557_02740 [Flavobacterium sp. MedPE-SWcel]|uniref:hypothetical protein n=1 Tax=uncultured Flavobacterium sp. TaxID=165435 RepID=UPI00091C8571|nr:hypothetical protein [uncultured Flavobacterium sp.]OIQ21731.1 MAG: hypothetical protein BM557_02740 [Flavobacterium sp. MedPE-SWcel]